MICSDEVSQKNRDSKGNTKPVPKQRKRYRRWFFTWNNYNENSVSKILELLPIKYAIQEERGEKGTKHLQGVLEFKNQVSFQTLTKLGVVHWEKCGNWKKAVQYCTKIETRDGQTWTKGVPEPISDPMENLTLKPWQENILNFIEDKPDDRKIYWFWEQKGNTGKTTFAKHLVLKYKALYVSGKSSDVKFGVASKLEEDQECKIVIWDVPRTQENYISYESIESVKNGLFFSGKYESKQILFKIPHIIIFANFPPHINTMSIDRWVIEEIN